MQIRKRRILHHKETKISVVGIRYIVTKDDFYLNLLTAKGLHVGKTSCVVCDIIFKLYKVKDGVLHPTARVILLQAHSIATCGCRTHTEETACD